MRHHWILSNSQRWKGQISRVSQLQGATIERSPPLLQSIILSHPEE